VRCSTKRLSNVRSIHGLRFVVSGGAPLTRELQEGLSATLGVPVLEHYGSSEAIWPILDNVLVSRFSAELIPPQQYQVDRKYRLEGQTISVFASSNIASVTTEKQGDGALFARIADALDAELATHQHDKLFPIK